MNDAAQSILEATNWAGLKHAYGYADDAKEELPNIFSDDPEIFNELRHYLYGAMIHQSTVYPATTPTMKFLLAAFPDLSAAAQEEVVFWLGYAAESSSEFSPLATEVFETILPIETNELVYYVALFEAWGKIATPDEQLKKRIITRLQQCLSKSKTTAEIAASVNALGLWGVDVSQFLTHPELAIRVSAAHYDRSDAGTDVLLTALADDDIEDAWSSINVSYSYYDFLEEFKIRNLSYERIKPLALHSINSTIQSWNMVFQYICTIWTPAEQYEFLTALTESDNAWSANDRFGNQTLQWAGLPDTRDSLRAFLEQDKDLRD